MQIDAIITPGGLTLLTFTEAAAAVNGNGPAVIVAGQTLTGALTRENGDVALLTGPRESDWIMAGPGDAVVGVTFAPAPTVVLVSEMDDEDDFDAWLDDAEADFYDYDGSDDIYAGTAAADDGGW